MDVSKSLEFRKSEPSSLWWGTKWEWLKKHEIHTRGQIFEGLLDDFFEALGLPITSAPDQEYDRVSGNLKIELKSAMLGGKYPGWQYYGLRPSSHRTILFAIHPEMDASRFWCLPTGILLKESGICQTNGGTGRQLRITQADPQPFLAPWGGTNDVFESELLRVFGGRRLRHRHGS